MVLPSAYSQIKKAITNPTSADLQEACLQASDWLRAFGRHNWAGSHPVMPYVCIWLHH